MSEGLAALQLVGIGYNDDFVNGISLSSGFPQQLNASFRTLQRSSAFLRGFPQTAAVFRKLQQSSAKYIGVRVGSFTSQVSYATTRLNQEGGVTTKTKCHFSGLPRSSAAFRVNSSGFPQSSAAFRILTISYGTLAAFRTRTSSSSFQEAFWVALSVPP